MVKKEVSAERAWLGRGVLFLLLCLAGFLFVHRQLLDDNLYSLRRGQFDLRLDMRDLSAEWTEARALRAVPSGTMRCENLTAEESGLGDRVCYDNLRSFNGVRALRLAFFFRDGELAQFKVDSPGWTHQDNKLRLLEYLGMPTGMQEEPHAGVRLVGWKEKQGSIFFNRDAFANPLEWNSVYWISHAEAERKGRVWGPAEPVVRRSYNLWVWLYVIYRAAGGS